MKFRRLLYRSATALSVLGAAGAAAVYFQKKPAVMTSFAELGYPEYFPALLGSYKVLGAVALSVPSTPLLKEWAYAGFAFTYTGAAVSHLVKGQTKQALAPVAALMLLVLSYAARPESKRV